MVTVDVQGNRQRWLKVRDLTKGVTYFFRVQARTIAYGPELQANVTAGPAAGEWAPASRHGRVTQQRSADLAPVGTWVSPRRVLPSRAARRCTRAASQAPLQP